MNAGKPFPSTSLEGPFVQRASLGRISAELLRHVVPISATVEAARITNANNQLASAALYLRAQISGAYAFRYP
jgi:hypothetical protein